MRDIPAILKEAAFGWVNDNAGRLSAALAYYAVFSIAPLLVIFVSIVGLVFGADAARGQVGTQLAGLVGQPAAETIQQAVAATGRSQAAGIWATLAGFLVLLLGASTVFGELKSALNMIWGVRVRPGRAIRTVIRDRFLSFSLVLSIGFLLLVSLAVSTALAALGDYLAGALPLPPLVWRMLDAVVSVTVISALFAMIYKILPDVVLRWRDVAAGAVFTALLFTAGKTVLAWYLGRNSMASAFGAAGALIVLLLWFYYATCILFLGAEVVKAWVRHRGRVEPRSYAMNISPPPKPAGVET